MPCAAPHGSVSLGLRNQGGGLVRELVSELAPSAASVAVEIEISKVLLGRCRKRAARKALWEFRQASD